MIVRFHSLLALAVAALGAATSIAVGCSSAPPIPDPCFDYGTFAAQTPKVTFKADVLPIFQRSCAISSTCHSETANQNPAQPFLGDPLSFPEMQADRIAIIFDQLIQQPGHVPTSTAGINELEPDGLNIVEPNQPSKSFMMFKLDGTGTTLCDSLKCAENDACGSAMPQGGPRLGDADLDTIRRWIAQGAKND